MSLTTVLLIALIVVLVAGLPAWGWHGHGYVPSGVVGLLILILLVFILLGGGRVRWYP